MNYDSKNDIGKRFRNDYGVLDRPFHEVCRLTRKEADEYYQSGQWYFTDGREYQCFRFQDKDAHGNLVECIKFTSRDGYNIFCDSKTMGSFLPDVASSGLEIIKIDEPEPQKKQNSIEKYCAGKTTPTHEIEKSF